MIVKNCILFILLVSSIFLYSTGAFADIFGTKSHNSYIKITPKPNSKATSLKEAQVTFEWCDYSFDSEIYHRTYGKLKTGFCEPIHPDYTKNCYVKLGDVFGHIMRCKETADYCEIAGNTLMDLAYVLTGWEIGAYIFSSIGATYDLSAIQMSLTAFLGGFAGVTAIDIAEQEAKFFWTEDKMKKNDISFLTWGNGLTSDKQEAVLNYFVLSGQKRLLLDENKLISLIEVKELIWENLDNQKPSCEYYHGK